MNMHIPPDLGQATPLRERSIGENVTAPRGLHLSGRANEFCAAFKPLSGIEPKLTSTYLVKHWLSSSGMSVLFGEPNVGKSFLALDMALHVAAHEPWDGCKIADNTGNVVYVAIESGCGFDNWLAALRREYPDPAERADNRLFTLTLATDFCSGQDAFDLAKALGELSGRTSLVVVDMLARSMGQGDENTSTDMGAFIRNIDLLREETGAHVMVVHHTGKDGSRGARGHSSLRAAVDTELHLTRDNDVIEAKATKQRDMQGGRVFTYELREVVLGQDQDGDDVTTCVVEPCAPAVKTPQLSGNETIAMQALDDAIAHAGAVKSGDLFPDNRKCVSVDEWREFCRRHALGGGEGSGFRNAYARASKSLHEKGSIRIVDGHVWRCFDGV